MSAPRMKFGGVVPTRSLPPIEFELEGVPQVFRATPKPPLKVIEAVLSIAPDETGRRRYAASMLLSSMEELVIDRLWVAWPDGEVPEGEDPDGRWVPVDDRDRMREVLHGPDYIVPIETIAAVVMGLIERTTGNPTGEPRP